MNIFVAIVEEARRQSIYPPSQHHWGKEDWCPRTLAYLQPLINGRPFVAVDLLNCSLKSSAQHGTRRSHQWISMPSDSDITSIILRFHEPVFLTIARVTSLPIAEVFSFSLSTNSPSHFSDFLSLGVSEFSVSHFMFHSGGRICEHLKMQLKSSISIVSESCLAVLHGSYQWKQKFFHLLSAIARILDILLERQPCWKFRLELNLLITAFNHPYKMSGFRAIRTTNHMQTYATTLQRTSESTDVNQIERKCSTDPNHWWPMTTWSIWVQHCESEWWSPVSQCRRLWQMLTFTRISVWLEKTWIRRSLLLMHSGGAETGPPMSRSSSIK